MNETPDTVEAIAIVGLACRFPGAPDSDTFWRNLRGGVESIRFFSAPELAAAGVDPALSSQPGYVPAHGKLDGVEQFDAAFFGYSPREAQIMDPQHRLFLECAWSAIEHAGHNPDTVGERCGVIASVGFNNYLINNILPRRDLATAANFYSLFIANDKDFLPTRVSYKLNLRGPSLNVNTACSSSLVAVHLACQQLWSYQCDTVLAGAAALQTPQEAGYLHQSGGIASADGHCRAFDAAAGGTVTGSGVGAVVLKRLSDAQAAGDTIYALIRGSACNNDGARKAGFTAPGIDGQAAVIAEAQAMAGVSAESIGYVEAHGTGTALGDPIEVAALSEAFATEARQYCWIGSVKTNIGHLDTASGIAGLIKATLALHHGAIPASLHYRSPNSKINFGATPFKVCSELTPWPRTASVRRAAVSSFGIGGSNAHVVLEEAPAVPVGAAAASDASDASAGLDKPRLFPLSAATPAALARAQQRLAAHLPHAGAMRDIAWTLAAGRRACSRAAFTVAADQATLAANLATILRTAQRPDSAPRIGFLFPGQGAQQAGAGRLLYRDEALFRDALDACAVALMNAGSPDVRPWLVQPASAGATEALRATELAQPALFALSYALTVLWRARGITPAAVLGHSSGEYAAAVCAGLLGLDDAARVLSTRARLMAELPAGAMAAVGMAADQLQPLLTQNEGPLSIAAHNASALCTVSGSAAAVASLGRQLAPRGVFFQLLQTAHAFHSPAVEPILARFRTAVDSAPFGASTPAFYSAVLGARASQAALRDPSLWVRQISEPVLFAPALEAMLADGIDTLIEVGSGHTLAALARQTRTAAGMAPLIVAGIEASDDERVNLLNGLGQLWLAGATPHWDALFEGEAARRIALPTYPFEPERHWVDPREATGPAVQTTLAASSTARRALADWFYLPDWRRAAPVSAATPASAACNWLVLGGASPFEQALQRCMAEGGARLSVLAAPHSAAAYEAVFDRLEASGAFPERILYCRFGPDAGDSHPQAGFDGLLHLVRALGRRSRAVAELVILGQHMAALHEGDALDPRQACLLSPIRVIPAELPGLACRAIDIDPLAAPARQARMVTAELLGANGAPMLALRGGQRWLPGVDALHLPELASAQPYRQGGTYLITGGLGGMGLLIAAHLAKSVKANLVLTGRRALPPMDQWEQAAAQAGCAIALGLDQLTPFLTEQEAHIERTLAIRTIEQRTGLQGSANELAAGHAIDYLKQTGLQFAAGARMTMADIYAACAVQPEFERLVGAMLNLLAEDGWLAREGNEHITVLRDFSDAPDTLALHTALCQQHPGMAAQFEMLAGCVAKYPDALSGRIPAISVLYPDGQRYVIAEAAALTEEHDNNRVYRTLLADLLRKLALEATADKPLRILEVGGGNAIMTGLIAEGLRGLHVEYVFTDIGRSFLQTAETNAREHGFDFFRFASFDISRDPVAQGFALGSFDAVIGLDVVHATAALRDTVQNLRQLLVQGGLFCLVESARTQRWNDMVWGLAAGWWFAQDESLRNPHSPLLSTARWENALDGCGFSSQLALPLGAERRARTDCSLIVAQNGLPPAPAATPAPALAATMAALLAISRQAGGLMVCQADVADEAAMARVLAQAQARFGPLHGVIHAAAVESKAVIAAREEPAPHSCFAAAELRPKVDGAVVLDRLLGDQPLDFMVLCSSISALTGGAGQAGYCAANSFLDAFAEQRSARRAGLTVAIAWGRWQGVGLAREFEAWHNARTGGQLGAGMSADEALEALRRILVHRIGPRVAVMNAEWRPELAAADGPAPTLPSIAAAPAPAIAIAFAGSPTEQQLAAIWKRLLGTDRFDCNTTFQELGGDSLVGIQMITRIRETLGVQLAIHSIFDHPTIAALARRIDAAVVPMEEGSL